MFVSALIRGEECTVAKCYSVTAVTLCYILTLSHNAIGLWRNIIASKSYHFGHKGAVISTYGYLSDFFPLSFVEARQKR
jgi:hypothetical protein